MKLAPPELPISSKLFLSGGRRLDGNPYLTDAVQARLTLDRLPKSQLVPLRELTKDGMNGIYHAGREGRRYVEDPEFGVRFLRSNDILAADLSNAPLLSKAQVARNPLFTIREGMTLITRSGTIGRMAYCRPDMSGLACSEDVLRVLPDPEKVLPGYLYAFLSSKYGKALVTGGTYGAIIQHIEPAHIAEIGIPRLDGAVEQEVHELIVESAHALTSSSEAYQAATRQIFELLGLKAPLRHEWHLDKRAVAFSTLNISASTLRALNYDPRALQLYSEFEKIKHSKLGDVIDRNHFVNRIIFTRIDAGEEFGVKLVGQRGAFQVRPDGRCISKSSVTKAGLMLSEGTVLIAGHGTLGETELYCRAVFLSRENAKNAYSGDFIRCIPLKEEIPPGYFFGFMRSETAFRILRSQSIGGKQQEHNLSLLANMPIPRLDPVVELEIHERVVKGAADFDRALICEDKAWQIVENSIREIVR